MLKVIIIILSHFIMLSGTHSKNIGRYEINDENIQVLLGIISYTKIRDNLNLEIGTYFYFPL